MDNIKQAWGKVQGGWQALDKSKKIQLGVILTAIILVVGGLTYITKKRRLQRVIFRNGSF